VVCSLQRAGIAAGIAANAADLCDCDRHLQARGYWTKVRTPEGESLEFDGIPVRLSATPGQVQSAGPRLGEHTDAVLQRVLKLSAAAVAELRSAKVIA
jgi:formyl-CoA transferase